MNEEQVASHVEALRAEKAGYEAKVAQAEHVNDADKAKLYTSRIADVDEQLAKFGTKKSKKSEKSDQ